MQALVNCGLTLLGPHPTFRGIVQTSRFLIASMIAEFAPLLHENDSIDEARTCLHQMTR